MDSSPILRPIPLRLEHPVGEFDCGDEALNRYLAEFALRGERSHSARTYVALSGGKIAGYYSLTVTSIEFDQGSGRLQKGLARHPIPMLLLARLAVDRRYQRKGLGTELLRDAMIRAISVSDQVGIRGVLVHAKNDAAKRFYEQFDFEPLPGNERHLVMLMKDLKRIVASHLS
jgi:GNAT superfamily N-acetyltransferase